MTFAQALKMKESLVRDKRELEAGMARWSLGSDPDLPPPPGMPPEVQDVCPQGYYGVPPNCHNAYLLLGGVTLGVGAWLYWVLWRKER